MKWFQLFKVHTFVNDALGHCEDLYRKMKELAASLNDHKAAVKATMEKDREEALAAIASDSEAMDTRIGVRMDAAEKSLREATAKYEAAIAETLKDAEEIKRAVERLHRREGEFTAMIDTRCREIGGKIRESIIGNIDAAVARAEAAAQKLSDEGVARSTEFERKLATHTAMHDRKLGMIADGLLSKEEVAEIVAAAKTAVLAEVDKKITAAPMGRNGTRR